MKRKVNLVVIFALVASMMTLGFGLFGCGVRSNQATTFPRGTGKFAPASSSGAYAHPFFGTWEVIKTIGHPGAPPDLLGNGPPPSPTLIGERIAYGPQEITSKFGNLREPIYHVERDSWNDFLGLYHHANAEQLGLPEYVNINAMTVVSVNYKNPSKIGPREGAWTEPGCILIIVDRDTMITLWNVDSFLMKRVRE